MRRIRDHLTYANVMATIAVFLVLSGGTAVALSGSNTVFTDDIVNDDVYSADVRNDSLSGGGLTAADLRPSSVGTSEVADNALGAGDLAPSSVGSSEVASDSLGGGDINESLLGIVPNADQLDGQDSSAFAQDGSEPWHEVGADGEPFFNFPHSCYWDNFDIDHNTAAFLRDSFGFVHLKGLVDANDDEGGCDFGFASHLLIFNLPAGYRPARQEVFATITNGELGQVNVAGPELNVSQGAGAVSVDLPTTEANAKEWISLDGISFRCAPSGSDGCP